MQARKMYNELAMKDRQQHLTRAYDASALTLPYLLPDNDRSKDDELPRIYSGVGARNVNNLSSKLMLTLFPPGSPYFRMEIDDQTLEELTQQEGMRAQVEEALGSRERTVLSKFEANALRVPLSEAIMHLIVAGNVLIKENKGKLKVYHMDQYVVLRDPEGEPLKIIIKELMSRELFKETFNQDPPENSDKDDQKPLALYTVVERFKGKYRVWQEVEDIRIQGSDHTFPIDKLPYLPLRWRSIDGVNWGIGLVGQYIDDFRALDGFSKLLLEGSAASARVLFGIRPNSPVGPNDMASLDNLDFFSANPDDVWALQTQKHADLSVGRQEKEDIIKRLDAAFLLTQSIQRQAERVTAAEINIMANELETSLGGIYALLSHELQLPLTVLLIADLERTGKLPPLPKDTVRPVIITGFDALGRSNDSNKMAMYIREATASLGPEAVLQYVNVGDYLKRSGVGFGIDMKGLLKTEEEVQQAQQAAQQQAMQQQALQSLGPQAVSQGGQLIRERSNGNNAG